MPNLIKDIKNTMIKKGISEELIAQFDFSEEDYNQPERILMLINHMGARLLYHRQTS